MSLKASVFIATSLDGFIARPDGGLDWLEHDSGSEDYGYHDFISTVDMLVMGRKSYEIVLAFDNWFYESTPVMVLSRTLRDADIPARLRGKVEITSATPTALVQQLATAGAKHLYIDGGQTIQAFLREGLIQEIIISRMPVLIGEGIPLFGALPHDIPLEHLKTQAFASGLVQSRYRVRSQNAQ